MYWVFGMPIRASDFSMSSMNMKSKSRELESSTRKTKGTQISDSCQADTQTDRQTDNQIKHHQTKQHTISMMCSTIAITGSTLSSESIHEETSKRSFIDLSRSMSLMQGE